MPYRIAGIDVHKKMVAVVASDVENEYQFERRMFGSNPEQLRSRAAWLLEQEVEVVMESTAQYWKPVCGKLWNGTGSQSARSGKAPARGRERCIWRRRNPHHVRLLPPERYGRQATTVYPGSRSRHCLCDQVAKRAQRDIDFCPV